MPATPTVEKVMQINIQYLQLGEPTENVFYAYNSDSWNPTNIALLKTAIENWLDDSWMPLVPASTVCNGYRLIDRTSATSYTEDVVFATPKVGGSGTSEPNNVSFCIEKVVQERYKGGHGRCYVPGIPTATRTGNFISSTSAGEFELALEDLRGLIESIHTDASFYGILRTSGLGATASTPRFARAISHRYADLVLDAQRRRLPNHNVGD